MVIKVKMADASTIFSFDDIYDKGYDKSYPSIELVRIESLFFNKKKGKLLDFGTGPGTNGLHFLKQGYDVSFIDVSKNAINKLKAKIIRNYKNKKYDLKIFTSENSCDFTKLPYKSNYFDYVVCMSVINNMPNSQAALTLLNEFNRVLKKNGKIVIDSNLQKNNYKRLSKIKNSTVLTKPHDKAKFTMPMYFPKSEKVFTNIVKKALFEIKDVGHSSFKVFSQSESEIIVSAIKK
tara:strand:+ start:306 stop:1010 length:705 start_codon:yes stop_codon:yes gene_type:complete